MHRTIFACLFTAAALFISALIAPVSHAQNVAESKVEVDSATPIYNAVSHRKSPVRKTKAKGTVRILHANEASPFPPHSASPMMPTMPVMPSAPIPVPTTGATNGTLAADGDIFAKEPTPEQPSSLLPGLLFASLSLSLIGLGVRSVLLKKRAPLWSYGMIAAGVLMLVGFLSFSDTNTMALNDAPSALSHCAMTTAPDTSTSNITPETPAADAAPRSTNTAAAAAFVDFSEGRQ